MDIVAARLRSDRGLQSKSRCCRTPRQVQWRNQMAQPVAHTPPPGDKECSPTPRLRHGVSGLVGKPAVGGTIPRTSTSDVAPIRRRPGTRWGSTYSLWQKPSRRSLVCQLGLGSCNCACPQWACQRAPSTVRPPKAAAAPAAPGAAAAQGVFRCVVDCDAPVWDRWGLVGLVAGCCLAWGVAWRPAPALCLGGGLPAAVHARHTAGVPSRALWLGPG